MLRLARKINEQTPAVMSAPPAKRVKRPRAKKPSPASRPEQLSAPSAAAPNAPECLICYSPIEHYTVTACIHSHGICGTCSLRMRLFLKREKKEEKKDEKEGKDAKETKEEAKIWECPFCKVPA